MFQALDIPKPIEAALRAQAEAEGKTLEALLLEVLAARAGFKETPASVGAISVTCRPVRKTLEHRVSPRHQLRRQSKPIPQHDMWVGAIVLQHDLALYSPDAHFEHLPQWRRA